MGKKRVFLLTLLTLMIMLQGRVYANSSWHWVTVSPKLVLPIAIILTLVIETFIIYKYGTVQGKDKVLIVVALANIASFVLPYIERAKRFMAVAGHWYYAWIKAFDSGPYYIVLTGYLILTLIVEFPIVYLVLKKYSKDNKTLGKAILVANIITTLIVAVLERLLCHGRW
ncbi:hypothetical protein [Clostridium malenominatum]